MSARVQHDRAQAVRLLFAGFLEGFQNDGKRFFHGDAAHCLDAFFEWF
ncbi:Uncharacterised protein [Mycobacteroides abscessus subsp. abscessus]|nr:Uncharacterised protein [Mycobacteroides abscessus subsp. abscessus]